MRFILQAAAAHAAIGRLPHRPPGVAVPRRRGTQPPGAGPARAERAGQHDPRLGEVGRPGRAASPAC